MPEVGMPINRIEQTSRGPWASLNIDCTINYRPGPPLADHPGISTNLAGPEAASCCRLNRSGPLKSIENSYHEAALGRPFSALSRQLSKLSSLKGLLRNPTAPAASTRARVISSAKAVMKMVGIVRP